MRLFRLVISVFLLIGVVAAGSLDVVGSLGLGQAFDPVRGLYSSARAATPNSPDLALNVDSMVTVVFDDRGVPHIFASNDLDAVRALGYVIAKDRLFQLDYAPRVAAGRLSELLGDGAVSADAYLRATGMNDGAIRNWNRIVSENGIEKAALEAFADGVNARINELEAASLPLEYRLLGARPEPFAPINSLLVQQLLTYDLSYLPPDEAFLNVVSRYGRPAFDSLYPTVMPFSVPIVKESGYARSTQTGIELSGSVKGLATTTATGSPPASSSFAGSAFTSTLFDASPASGHHRGTGSNNWTVSGAATESGAPLLAGDMHLGLTVPSIWYEVHIVTPGMDVYGVTTPGAPTVVAGITDSLAWTFTNTGADQIDHYVLRLDSSGTQYRFEGAWHELGVVEDTIRVNGKDPEIRRRYTSRFGPIITFEDASLAVRWVGHRQSRTILALWGMNHASNLAEFETAVEKWDSPMQNIAYADVRGNTRLRSTGYLPVRAVGDGCGVLDGTNSNGDWVGRVGFDRLPVVTEARPYATSTNQLPEVTASFYLNCRWDEVFRSHRIDDLLSTGRVFGVDDMRAFQADVYSGQAELFVPLLAGLELSPGARDAATRLAAWDRMYTTGSTLGVLFDTWMDSLQVAVWDEPAFANGDRPHLSVLHQLALDDSSSRWFDRLHTPEVETAGDILSATFEGAVSAWSPERTWGMKHKLVVRHVSRLDQLAPLWRGPFPFSGYDETLSPGRGDEVTHSASWRVVVDLSTVPPTSSGVYPGGQSGDPLSELYDNTIDTYLRFEYLRHKRPKSPREINGRVMRILPRSS